MKFYAVLLLHIINKICSNGLTRNPLDYITILYFKLNYRGVYVAKDLGLSGSVVCG